MWSRRILPTSTLTSTEWLTFCRWQFTCCILMTGFSTNQKILINNNSNSSVIVIIVIAKKPSTSRATRVYRVMLISYSVVTSRSCKSMDTHTVRAVTWSASSVFTSQLLLLPTYTAERLQNAGLTSSDATLGPGCMTTLPIILILIVIVIIQNLYVSKICCLLSAWMISFVIARSKWFYSEHKVHPVYFSDWYLVFCRC